MKNKTLIAVMVSGLLAAPALTFACGGSASGKHMGNVVSVDPAHETFTIQDAETSSPITFNANQEILAGLEKAHGTVMVNYEEDDEGALKAVGVTF